MVGAPVGDCLFDGFGFEFLRESAVCQGGDLFVAGEAEGSELFYGQLVDVRKLIGWDERGETKPLFKADDAVLHREGVDTGFEGEDKKSESDDDGPETEEEVLVPEVDGDVDGDSDVDHHDEEDEEVHRGIESCVVLEVLGFGHCCPFPSGSSG